MKPNKKIVFLFIAVAAIVVCWLMPGVNTARQTRYTRIYEDTDAKAVTTKPDSLPHTQDAGRAVKKYITESIEADAQLDDIKVEMFSRALHFEEKVWVDTILAERSHVSDTLYKREMR